MGNTSYIKIKRYRYEISFIQTAITDLQTHLGNSRAQNILTAYAVITESRIIRQQFLFLEENRPIKDT